VKRTKVPLSCSTCLPLSTARSRPALYSTGVAQASPLIQSRSINRQHKDTILRVLARPYFRVSQPAIGKCRGNFLLANKPFERVARTTFSDKRQRVGYSCAGMTSFDQRMDGYDFQCRGQQFWESACRGTGQIGVVDKRWLRFLNDLCLCALRQARRSLARALTVDGNNRGRTLNGRQTRLRKRATTIAEIKMRKTLVTTLCLAVIAASSIQAAAAAKHPRAAKESHKLVVVNDQHRNSNNRQPRDSNVGGMCGIFPGPCQ
jgi:hypothetical protein